MYLARVEDNAANKAGFVSHCLHCQNYLPLRQLCQLGMHSGASGLKDKGLFLQSRRRCLGS